MDRLPFLDVPIIKNETNEWEMDIFRKSTNTRKDTFPATHVLLDNKDG